MRVNFVVERIEGRAGKCRGSALVGGKVGEIVCK